MKSKHSEWTQWDEAKSSRQNLWAAIESYTMPLIESSSDNIPSCSWPNHSSDDVLKWSLRGHKVSWHTFDAHLDDGVVCERQSYCWDSSQQTETTRTPAFQLSTTTADQTQTQTSARCIHRETSCHDRSCSHALGEEQGTITHHTDHTCQSNRPHTVWYINKHTVR